eukprot:TRINITY_DN2983_c0_g2_i4.p1 TRINITY_DN2983_c0_g2~~TRINITY_DN2983_c0_g2_i4.p1  ORF type:complete len:140 (+),score=35.10 TRINITY_DN2983_c0_g2_i4:53-472(+)
MLTAECAGVCVTMCCARAVAAARVFVCGVRACFLVEGGGGVVEDDAPADPDDFGEPANDHHFPDPKRQLVRVRVLRLAREAPARRRIPFPCCSAPRHELPSSDPAAASPTWGVTTTCGVKPISTKGRKKKKKKKKSTLR